MSAACPFALVEQGAAGHFKLVLLGTALQLIEMRSADGSAEGLGFADGYRSECAALWDGTVPSAAAWFEGVRQWSRCQSALPFARLDAAGFGAFDRTLLATLALVEEDGRFAFLIEPDGSLPTVGGMIAAWRAGAPGREAGAVRDRLLEMAAAGFVGLGNVEAPRSEWRVRLPPPLLEALASGVPRLDGARHDPHGSLPEPGDWLGEADPARLGAIVAGDPACLLVARGPRNNGRKTLLRIVARCAGKSVLAVAPALLADAERWRVAGAAALAANAVVLAELEIAAGESFEIPAHPVFAGPIGIACGTGGGVRAPPDMRLVDLVLGLPDADAREAHWRRAGLGAIAGSLAGMTLTSGNIRRAAAAASAQAALRGGDEAVTAPDVRAALAALRSAGLDAVARRIDGGRAPEPLHLDERDREEFEGLLLRCRHREALGAACGRGVRALFTGPSGTGKTLAGRHIAAALGKQLYRVDLAAAVSKYIGETEKNLDRALGAAEELNIVLLLDEGDALMARRTAVGSSNDRYANLETNFLLQRIEAFEGIIIVTSNDADRIDPAFARRMDAVIAFRMPDEVRRHRILAQQLGEHEVSDRLLQEVACRCALSGGQLHNLALHARLLAIEARTRVTDEHLRRAVIREYRKTGDYCPLKGRLAAVG